MSQNELQLQIDGIALQQRTDKQDSWLPDVAGAEQFPPYPHQVEMQEIIEEKDEMVVVNMTVTGGGKTYSYSVPVMRTDMFAIVVFPTNPLIEDQFRTINELATTYFPDKAEDEFFVRKLTSDSMQDRREMERQAGVNGDCLNNSEIIRNTLDEAHHNDGPSFVLTNPDVFTRIARGKYGGHVRQKLGLAEMVVVDEFHHARAKGRNSMLYTLDELYHRSELSSRIDKFVFLSATPDEELQERLKTKFGRATSQFYHELSSRADSKPVSQIQPSDDYRAVMPQVNMDFVPSRPFATKNKLLEDEDLFSRMTRFLGDGRSIVILDGVAEVNEVYKQLEQALPKRRVEPISGLRSDNTSEKLSEADIIVANSTLEVGVDIGEVDQLVFSGFNASRFMQRLGRLRADDPDGEVKSAACFTMPDAIRSFRSLKENNSAVISRERFQNRVEHMLRKQNDPELYRAEFAPVEFYRAIKDYSEDKTHDTMSQYQKNALKLVEKHCFSTVTQNVTQHDVQQMWDRADSPLGEAMQSYRNSSLSSLVYDERTQSVKTYQIPALIRFGDIEFLTQPEFELRLKKQGIDPSMYSSEQQYVQSHAWLNGRHDKDTMRSAEIVPGNLIQYQLSLDPTERSPQSMNGIRLTVDEKDTQISGLQTLNKQLDRDAEVLAYATEGHPAQLQAIYDLDEFFFTTEIANLNGNYSLAMGENALYLHCHVQENIASARKLREQYR